MVFIGAAKEEKCSTPTPCRCSGRGEATLLNDIKHTSTRSGEKMQWGISL